MHMVSVCSSSSGRIRALKKNSVERTLTRRNICQYISAAQQISQLSSDIDVEPLVKTVRVAAIHNRILPALILGSIIFLKKKNRETRNKYVIQKAYVDVAECGN